MQTILTNNNIINFEIKLSSLHFFTKPISQFCPPLPSFVFSVLLLVQVLSISLLTVIDTLHLFILLTLFFAYKTRPHITVSKRM